LPTWDEALAALDDDPDTTPAHTVRAGRQADVQAMFGRPPVTSNADDPACEIHGHIAGPKAEKAIGYLTKYLTKSIAEGITDAEPSARQRAHADRLAEQARWLPCSPECANWLRFGLTPKDPDGRMIPDTATGARTGPGAAGMAAVACWSPGTGPARP
jgi:hypothetical protein